MKTDRQLLELLRSMDHKSYPAYKALKGSYRFQGFELRIDHVQGDPFAAPSHVSLILEYKSCGFPEEFRKDSLSRKTLADYLNRQFEKTVQRYTFRAKGSGKSGLIAVSRCSQEILDRTALEVTGKEIIVRFHVGFPANGRTINARELEKIFFDFLPKAAEEAFYYRKLDREELISWLYLREDQAALREYLKKEDLAAFVADGAVLPRESGVSEKPMKGAVPFRAPDSLRVTAELPHRGKVTGLGIRRGITLIVGGGYHGKSTLLDAIQLGVYDHIPGDGRELVITDPEALKLRSEDGRFVKDVDISMFINNLPNRKDTSRFCTMDASGSTSQAAGLSEGLEAGSKVFLLDEDTSATNFMVRDDFMQRVIAREKEPITPFLERAKELFSGAGVSTILVAGSSGAFFHIADTVIQMDNYVPKDITARVKELCSEYPLTASSPEPFHMPEGKRIMTKQEPPKKHKNYYGETVDRPERLKVKTFGKDGFSLGKQDVDLKSLEQITDTEQTEALAFLLKYAFEKLIDGRRTLPEIVEYLNDRLRKEGQAFFEENGYVAAGFALPRRQEIYSCFNRYRRP